MTDTIETRIRELLIEICDLAETDGIQNENELSKFGLNSMGFIKMVAALETEFGFEFGDKDLQVARFQTIREVADYIHEHI